MSERHFVPDPPPSGDKPSRDDHSESNDVESLRSNLAQLLGRLLARHWLRQHTADVPADDDHDRRS